MAAKTPKRKRGEWRTAEGEILKLADMTTRHIESCLAMLDRHVLNYKEEAQSRVSIWRLMDEEFFNNEQGWQSELIANASVDQLRPAVYAELRAELRRRHALEKRMLDGMNRWVAQQETKKK